jgi:ribosomal protein S18 acetylase RimI-like enzyme
MSTDLSKRVVIREARPEDDAAVGELLVEAFITQYAKKLPEVVYTEERKRSLRDVAGKRAVARVWVAELEGRVVGTVALWPPGAPGSEAWLPGAADLRHLATSVDFHGQGLSKPLLDEAERVAREEWRVPAICLHVRRGVEGVARMYQRRGFLREPSADLDTPSVYLEAFVLRFAR